MIPIGGPAGDLSRNPTGRGGIPLLLIGTLGLIISLVTSQLVLMAIFASVMVVGLVVYFRLGTLRRAPITVQPPVRGRWLAFRSPTSGIPSHGSQAYGQTYAMDLIHSTDERPEPVIEPSPIFRAANEYSSFDQEIHSPCDGVVVTCRSKANDHKGRMSWPGVAYFSFESLVRELCGPARIFGNHLVIKTDGGYMLLAHLKKDSVRVGVGDQVHAGQLVGLCGNSGNSGEPHLHMQLMDHRLPLFAAGLPFVFDTQQITGETVQGLPTTKSPFEVHPIDITEHTTDA